MEADQKMIDAQKKSSSKEPDECVEGIRAILMLTLPDMVANLANFGRTSRLVGRDAPNWDMHGLSRRCKARRNSAEVCS
jgi:hypothetical protein